jgi:hypothetical protein
MPWVWSPDKHSRSFPLTQQHVADALGLSLVHTNKTLARLRRMGMFKQVNGMLTLTNPRVLEHVGQYFDEDILAATADLIDKSCRRPADGKYGSIIPRPGRVRSRNDMRVQ